MQSNPIQQRIELICEKWEEAKKFTKARIVHIRCQPDETDMVETFYTYMIGADTPIMDIAFHLDAVCSDVKQFSHLLLSEIEEMVDIWNNSEKDSRIDYVPIRWKPDMKLADDKNPAALFVRNFNNLATEMGLGEDLYAVAILKGPSTGKKLVSWLSAACETTIDSRVKFLIYDTVANPWLQDLVKSYPGLLTTIPLNLNMPKAMEQVAAMGDPNDPATEYRQVFMKMMNEMGAGNEGKAEKWGGECIRIASNNIPKDPFWITQAVVVYIALANDKIRYKNKAATLDYAQKAVDTATASKEFFENGMAELLLAQTIMFRGTVLFIQDKKADAYNDFIKAFELYNNQSNIPLAIESSRMAGESGLKSGQKKNAAKILAEGVRLGNKMDADMAAGTTFAGLLELLLHTNHDDFITAGEVDEIAQRFYGPDWRNVVKNWKQVPDNEKLKKQELAAAEG